MPPLTVTPPVPLPAKLKFAFRISGALIVTFEPPYCVICGIPSVASFVNVMASPMIVTGELEKFNWLMVTPEMLLLLTYGVVTGWQKLIHVALLETGAPLLR
jgi:hypothetical protein